jgi:selenocysteine-specific elongation factor
MKYVVFGTAGHIDHGKTSLVRALTGVDTDRLEEEKRRGISIDLGFAHLDLTPEIRIAFVDVPGHERFIKNMLAGAGGIDSVVFIVAADESIKPQTREHFEICRLLNLRSGVIALTKSDLVDPDILDLVRLEVEEFVAGSFLDGAPVVAVSATTGAGLETLREELKRIAATATGKDDSQHLRLPIDRSFVMRGFGTVVTGTLVAGRMSVEQEVEVHPGERRLRVRGIQTHGKAAKQARAGQRTAVNIAGAEHSELARGMVLTEAGLFHATQQVDCSFELLASAKPLKNRAPVHFHAGTTEVLAEARLLEGSEALAAGARGFVRFLLRDPVLLLPGDRFIVRMFSPVVTIGGGAVLDIAAPRKIRRAGAVARLHVLSEGEPGEKIRLLVRESQFGLGLAELVARTGMRADAIEKAAVKSNLAMIREPQPWLLDADWVNATLTRWRTLLANFHRANPLQPGLAKEQLRSRELAGAPAFLVDVLLSREKTIVSSGDIVHLASHKVAFKQDEEQALAKIEAAFEKAGLAVPNLADVLASSGVEAARSRSLLQILLRNKRLIKIGDELVFHPSALASLREMLLRHKGESFAVPDFKDWTGVSRKYAIPLLEYLDREHVTRRAGDMRLVL